jgi:hypothetical protein
MTEDFPRSAKFVLSQEVRPGHELDGDLHTDPNDPGGTTRWGISQRYNPHVDLVHLDKQEDAFVLYHSLYWEPAACDALPWPLDIIVFDTAFNCGLATAHSILLVTKDPDTYLWNRVNFYYLRKASPYFAGWIKRVYNLAMEIRR